MFCEAHSFQQKHLKFFMHGCLSAAIIMFLETDSFLKLRFGKHKASTVDSSIIQSNRS